MTPTIRRLLTLAAAVAVMLAGTSAGLTLVAADAHPPAQSAAHPNGSTPSKRPRSSWSLGRDPYVIGVTYTERRFTCRFIWGATFGSHNVRYNYGCGNPPGFPRASYPFGLGLFGDPYLNAHGQPTVTLMVSVRSRVDHVPQPGFTFRIIGSLDALALVGPAREDAKSIIRLGDPRCLRYHLAVDQANCIYRLWRRDPAMVPVG